MDLLQDLEGRAGVVLGLLTGNFPETGAIKLRACGIDPDRFSLQVWGDQSPHVPPCRTHLPAVGMSRYRETHGEIECGRVTVIGDTPHDVACALANGCRSLGVATGSFSSEELRRAGADHVVSDLSATQEIAAWLLG
jgi:phosphoglycolate phosphatase